MTLDLHIPGTHEILSCTSLHKRVMELQGRLLVQGLPSAPGAWGRVDSLMTNGTVVEALLLAGAAGAAVALASAATRRWRRRPVAA